MSIESFNISRLQDDEVLVDLEYNKDGRYYNGGSSVKINTKANGCVDSVTVREYDENGNLVSSEAFFT